MPGRFSERSFNGADTVNGMFVWIYVRYPISFLIEATEKGSKVAASEGVAGPSHCAGATYNVVISKPFRLLTSEDFNQNFN